VAPSEDVLLFLK